MGKPPKNDKQANGAHYIVNDLISLFFCKGDIGAFVSKLMNVLQVGTTADSTPVRSVAGKRDRHVISFVLVCTS